MNIFSFLAASLSLHFVLSLFAFAFFFILCYLIIKLVSLSLPLPRSLCLSTMRHFFYTPHSCKQLLILFFYCSLYYYVLCKLHKWDGALDILVRLTSHYNLLHFHFSSLSLSLSFIATWREMGERDKQNTRRRKRVTSESLLFCVVITLIRNTQQEERDGEWKEKDSPASLIAWVTLAKKHTPCRHSEANGATILLIHLLNLPRWNNQRAWERERGEREIAL